MSMIKLLKKNTTVDQAFNDTGRTWEESGSLISIYECVFCEDQVNGYSRSTHLWYHKYLRGLVE